MNRGQANHFHAIDLGRGLAALAILVWHFQHFVVSDYDHADRTIFPFYQLIWPLYERGGLAVQFFWIVSGFIFPAVYVGAAATFKSFMAHRLARLYPLHLLTLLVVAVLQGLCRLQFGHDLIFPASSPGDFVLQLFMASGWPKVTNFSFNGPVWSVSAEVLVYILFWLTLPRLYRFGIVGPLLLAALSFSFRSWQPANCAGYFFLGASLYDLHHRSTLRVQVALVALLAAASVAAFRLDQVGIGFLAACLGIVLALAAADRQGIGSLASRVPWIADNCYGSYLWHIPVQLILLLGLGGVGAQTFLQPWFFIAYIMIVMVAARASFVWFERPARGWVRRQLLGH